VKGKRASIKSAHASALGSALTVLLGWLIWAMPAGDPWVNASFDYQLRFGSRTATNKVALVLMDNAAFDQFKQHRGQPWDRRLHAQLLSRLADDECKLVVMDSFFRGQSDPAKDEPLLAALHRLPSVVLMAEQSQLNHPTLSGVQPALPWPDFLQAANASWGIAWLNPDLDSIVRRHWPFPSPGPHPSLPWSAALSCGASLDSTPQDRWLRYYGPDGAWVRMSYGFALAQPAGFFRDYVVFVGNEPKTSHFDGEVDEFKTPYSRWTGESAGGVEILATMFLNLVNQEALVRPAEWLELLLLGLSGACLGAGACLLRWRAAFGTGALLLVVVPLSAVLLSHHTNYWFPWLIIVGAQLPFALGWSSLWRLGLKRKPATAPPREIAPQTPDYELVQPAFGLGAYGRVWLARTRTEEWRAVKAIYLSHFNGQAEPYHREYDGIEKYMRLSHQHPGLLQVDYVSPKGQEYFYYVMELGDSVNPGWEQSPTLYKPRDLSNELARLPERRLPIRECVRIGIKLCSALDFIHRQGLTHRDIKPQNIIFVRGEPKLADLGLITHIRAAGKEGTLVGTPGFMPPPPDQPGTVSADIYALGVVLYVLSTGRPAARFPEMATTLLNQADPAEFLALNNIILTACEPLPKDRFATAARMRAALEALSK
jgi:CHASE2 domain-containing sensor protein